MAGTIRELHPGEWFVVRGRSRLDPYDKWWSEKFKESTPLNVKTSVGLVLNAEAYTPDSDGDLLTEKCLPLSTKRANQLDLALWPSSR